MAYIAIAVNFYLAPVLMLENVAPNLGIMRAYKLGRARFWRTLQLVIGIALILFVFQLILGYLAAVVTGVDVQSVDATNNAAYLTLDVIVTILITPVLPIALTIMYYDTRIRVERLDEALREVSRPDPRPLDVASPKPEGRMLDSQDFGNVALLTIGGLALLVFLTPLVSALTQVFFGV